MATMTVDIPDRLRQRAESVAVAKGKTIQDVMVSALAAYVESAGSLVAPTDADQLRAAAEAARLYYSTDPDALAWAEFPGDDVEYPER